MFLQMNPWKLAKNLGFQSKLIRLEKYYFPDLALLEEMKTCLLCLKAPPLQPAPFYLVSIYIA